MTEPCTLTFTVPPPHSNSARFPVFGDLPPSPGANSLSAGSVAVTLPSTPSSSAVLMTPLGSPVLLHFRPLVSQPVNVVTFLTDLVVVVISPVAVPARHV